MWYCLLLILNAQNLDQRPMSEMRGDCDNYALELSAEFQAWQKEPHPVTAETAQGREQKALLNRKMVVALLPMAQVPFRLPPPEGKRGFEGTFGGVLTLSVDREGDYRFCLGSKVWLDVIDPNDDTALDERLFEMQTRCERIFKVVVFHLKPGRTYHLQLAFAAEEGLAMLVSRQEP